MKQGKRTRRSYAEYILAYIRLYKRNTNYDNVKYQQRIRSRNEALLIRMNNEQQLIIIQGTHESKGSCQ
jgi:hypothetical protein